METKAIDWATWTPTETATLLFVVRGDEILQMGAVRIVNGKLLRSEGFDRSDVVGFASALVELLGDEMRTDGSDDGDS